MTIKAPVGSGSPILPGRGSSYVRPWARGVYIRQRSRARSRPGSFVFLYIYPAPLGVVVASAAWRRLEGHRAAVERHSIQDPASELRRIPIPRTLVNKGPIMLPKREKALERYSALQ